MTEKEHSFRDYDFSKTDRELFEIEYKDNPSYSAKFHTWCDEEQLYTDPQLCFKYQLFCTLVMKMARMLHNYEEKHGRLEDE